MREYSWWRKQKRRIQKKYTLFLGRYLSQKELKDWYKQRDKALKEWLKQEDKA